MKKVLTIAGSDCSGGAGIQADLKTMAAHGVYGMSAITALTAQNTTGVYDVMEVEPAFVAKQIDCIFQDIEPDAVKIGMVASKEIINVIADKMKEYKVENLVVDPVMVATSGSSLILDDAMEVLCNELLPLAKVITPNLMEAEKILGKKIASEQEMEEAAKELSHKFGVGVLIKGGHFGEDANDILYTKDTSYWMKGKRIVNPNTHGTGCTLSSAIASNLACNKDLQESVKEAKEYISGAIAENINLGKGRGPLHHMYNNKRI